MKPTVDAYTIAIPWYGREDFTRMWELADDRDVMPSDYEVWHRDAVAVVNTWLARGRALQIVTIRPDKLLDWLAQRALPNTAETRLRFAEEQATSDHYAA